MSYSEDEKQIKKEVLYFTTFCLQIADMITPENKKELINSIIESADIAMARFTKRVNR